MAQFSVFLRRPAVSRIVIVATSAQFMSMGLFACSTASSTNNTGTPETVIESSSVTASAPSIDSAPATRFDLSHWKLTLPIDSDLDGKVDGINTADLQHYSHDEFFYLDEQGHMVFTAPNAGATTANSYNTRSELRHMSRGSNKSIKTHDPLNNFALSSHTNANAFASIGGKMEATLHVDHMPLNANKPKQASSYAAVVGQIHAIKYKNAGDGFGYGNEPLKIFYKKWPGHETGSVYWNYERNLKKSDPDKKDISYLVWGKSKRDSTDPGATGIKLGEDFSYSVNVYEDTMYLVFENSRLETVRYQINLANNINANGEVDEIDNRAGYAQDAHYFKAGVYNQCRAALKENETEQRCGGTGDWAIDQANGDYAQVSFSRLVVSNAEPQ